MSRVAKPKAVPARMYAHFAVITLVITASLGLFADGESREQIAAEIANSSRPDESDDAPLKALKGGLHKNKTSFSFGGEAGTGVANEGFSGGSSDGGADFLASQTLDASKLPRRKPVPPKIPGPPGSGLEDVQTQNAEAAPTASEIETMLAASRARSGSSGSFSD